MRVIDNNTYKRSCRCTTETITSQTRLPAERILKARFSLLSAFQSYYFTSKCPNEQKYDVAAFHPSSFLYKCATDEHQFIECKVSTYIMRNVLLPLNEKRKTSNLIQSKKQKYFVCEFMCQQRIHCSFTFKS